MYAVDRYKPKVPSAFMAHDDIRFVLNETIEGFHPDEKEAIFFFYILDATIHDIAKTTRLMPGHVVSVLNLYAERLESKLCFFKKFVPYNDNESLPADAILFMDAPA